MTELYVGYGLFILYTFVVVICSAILWIVMYLSGIGVVYSEQKTGIAGGRKWAVLIFVVASIAQWILLCWCNHVIRVMWHSLPPFPTLW